MKGKFCGGKDGYLYCTLLSGQLTPARKGTALAGKGFTSYVSVSFRSFTSLL